MKRLGLVSALALTLCAAAPALAADLSARYPVKAVPAAPVFSWTGFYVGGSVGYGWGDAASSGDVNRYLAYYYESFAVNGNGLGPDGWFGGVQAGYNFQYDNNVVLGIEVDFSWGDLSDSLTYVGSGDPFPEFGTLNAKIDWFGTARLRLGYAFDRFLPYVTGGIAWAHVNYDETYTDNVDLYESYSTSKTKFGWTIGGGAEYAFTNNWTAKVEYLYADLGSIEYDSGFSGASFDVTVQTVKLGVNYKF